MKFHCSWLDGEGHIYCFFSQSCRRGFPTFFYIRAMLRTQVTPEEARKICFLFDGSLDGRWYNLKSLRKIDRDQRRDFLFHFANKIGQATGRGKIFHFAESQHESSQQRKDAPPRVDPAVEYLHVLGLTRRPGSVDELKIAYRRKISTFHPDRFANEKPEVRKYAEEMSKRINLAYQWLYERMQAPA